MGNDERYVIDLISEILNEDYIGQKRFDSLLGDPGINNRRVKLPVDAFFTKSNLIVEYKEKQHLQPVEIMDRRMTISGVNRGDDLRKEKWAEDNKIRFLSITNLELSHRTKGKLLRNKEEDREVIRRILGLA